MWVRCVSNTLRTTRGKAADAVYQTWAGLDNGAVAGSSGQEHSMVVYANEEPTQLLSALVWSSMRLPYLLV